MCGIIGVVASNKCKIAEQKLLVISKKLFSLSESRGKEASGFAGVLSNKIIVYKTPYSAHQLITSKEYKNVFKELFRKSNPTRAFIGHSRLVTDGCEHENRNNQPVIKNGMTVVHNGIIVNKRKLWGKYNHVRRETELESELIPVILHEHLNQKKNESEAFQVLFKEIYGMTNIAILSSSLNNLLLATNNGSIYYISDQINSLFLFASERYFLERLVNELKLRHCLDIKTIRQLEPLTALSVAFNGDIVSLLDLKEQNGKFKNLKKSGTIKNIQEMKNDSKNVFINTSLENYDLNPPVDFLKEYEKRREKISKLKRCTKCILPETFPFIEYDEEGVCNYCRNYKLITYKGLNTFREHIELFLTRSGDHDCLIPFSGGRDSSYTLHIAVKELGLKPLAYSYDWGMITDLARRNQSRMCGKLGVEHILISADIRKKRANIRKNVLAWLKKPNLGTVPLFMAGDKQYFYYTNKIMNQNNLKLSILGENILENTQFKSGFCGIEPNFDAEHIYTLKLQNKIKIAAFYGKEYILNPAYINSSLLDTIEAFRSYYIIKHNNVNLYAYLKWDEKSIEETLRNEYDWEIDPGTTTTWRIGDGTAAFYNYIYYMLAGFTENDTFRSNQIREGMLTRDEALKLVNEENKPRWDSLKWYCDTIGIDLEIAIDKINNIKTLY